MLNYIKNIGPTELAIIALVLVLFFGGKAIARLARTGGETVKELKNVKKEFSKAMEDDGKKS